MSSPTDQAQIPSSLVGTQWPGVGFGVYIRKGDTFLVGRRGSNSSHAASVWCPPGGKLDFGESFEEGARREVEEESGIQIKNIRVLGVTNDHWVDEGKHFVTVALVADYVSGEPTVREEGKMEAWEWITWDEFKVRPHLMTGKHLIEQGLSPFEIGES